MNERRWRWPSSPILPLAHTSGDSSPSLSVDETAAASVSSSELALLFVESGAASLRRCFCLCLFLPLASFSARFRASPGRVVGVLGGAAWGCACVGCCVVWATVSVLLPHRNQRKMFMVLRVGELPHVACQCSVMPDPPDPRRTKVPLVPKRGGLLKPCAKSGRPISLGVSFDSLWDVSLDGRNSNTGHFLSGCSQGTEMVPRVSRRRRT